MEILWFKTLSLLVIFITGLFAGLIPRKIGMTPRGEQQLTLSNAFAAGIFLGAGLLHMLPDAQANFRLYAGEQDFPFPMLIAGFGFLLVLGLEKAALRVKEEDIGTLSKEKVLYPFILCLVLSVHSIIAGVSLGLEATLLSATAIFIAIIAHKGAAAFSLGVSLKENAFTARRHLWIIVFFAIMTPLGLGLGTAFAASLSSHAANGFEAIFDALAAGTFLYIAVVDIMEDVFKKAADRWTKTLLIASGFSLMALIAIWA